MQSRCPASRCDHVDLDGLEATALCRPSITAHYLDRSRAHDGREKDSRRIERRYSNRWCSPAPRNSSWYSCSRYRCASRNPIVISPQPARDVLDRAGGAGQVLLAVLTVGVNPVEDEFFFRWLLQRAALKRLRRAAPHRRSPGANGIATRVAQRRRRDRVAKRPSACANDRERRASRTRRSTPSRHRHHRDRRQGNLRDRQWCRGADR